MAGDLGSTTGEVHAWAAEVVRFWLDETRAEKRFAKDAALDGEIAGRFGALRDRVVATDAAGWRDDPVDLLAAVILIDQFSRNIHRGQAEAFAGDALARALSAGAIAHGWDTDMPADRRQFLYMPFMHSESPADQARSVMLFDSIGDADQIKFARLHADQIARFGRFPGRNAALGRASTPDETEFLSRPGAGF